MEDDECKLYGACERQGPRQQVDKMLDWLAKGPPQAEVVNVEAKQVPWQEHHFFAIS